MSYQRFLARSAFICPLVLLGIAPCANATIIAGGDGTQNTGAPPGVPGWANVGALGVGSGIYLGNRWVLTAAHVGSGSITFNGNGTFDPVAGSAVRIQNADSTDTDLLLFQLQTDPGLPSLSIGASTSARSELRRS